MGSKNGIVPLNDGNYATWKIQAKMNLMKEDLFSIATGDETEPDGAEANGGAAAVAKFRKRRDKCLALLVLSVDYKLLYLLGDPTDPVVVWNKLQSTFQRKTWANKLRLRRKLYGMKLENSQDLQAHLKSFIEVFDELSVIGDALEDEDKVINLLASLPDNYSTLVTALEASDTVPAWETVTERLLHEEQKMRTKQEGTSSWWLQATLQNSNVSIVTKRVTSRKIVGN